MRIFIFIFLAIIFCVNDSDVLAQKFTVKGSLIDDKSGEPLVYAQVGLENTPFFTTTDTLGRFKLLNITPGNYILITSLIGYPSLKEEINITNKDIELQLKISSSVAVLKEVIVSSKLNQISDIRRLNPIEGTAIYSGKKSEVIVMDHLVANLATNNSRQIYSKIPGLNIWESDGAGIQLGIGGRGLNPNRVSNFNTRQNGYDISADALGYPESYYAPSAEGVDRIEILRGAASLQYGTQFGGFINFRMKKGPQDKPLELTSRQTLGSFGFFNSFNSIGGTIKKLSYYSFYQHKRGDGWRPNSAFENNVAYGAVNYSFNEKFAINAEYTFMNYLAQQPGGLTDALFKQDPRQSIRERNWFKVNWSLASISADYKISDYIKINTLFFGLYANRSALGVLSFINRADHGEERDLWTDDFRNYGNETRLLMKYHLNKNLSAFLIGFRYYNGFTDRRQGLGNDGKEGNISDFQFLHRDDTALSDFIFPSNNKALFAENIFQLNSKLSITPGIRIENIQTNAYGTYRQINKDFAGNVILNETIQEQKSNSRSFLLMGLGSSYQTSRGMEIYANISQNYRSINFNDIRIINDNLKVDPNLADERGMTLDIGIRGEAHKAISYDISLFLIKMNDRIGSINLTDTLTLTTYRYRTNISNSRNGGLESFIEVDLLHLLNGTEALSKLCLFANFSLIDAKYVGSKESAYDGKIVELVPNVILKTGLSYKRKPFCLSYQFSYVSHQYTDASNAEFTSNAVNGIIPSYFVMDLSAEYSYKYFTLSSGVNNLTNNRYFTRRADGYPGPGIIPSDGRSLYLTLQVKL